MKKTMVFLLAFLIADLLISVCLFLGRAESVDDPAAREIMRKVEDRDDGDNRTHSMLMELIDKNGAVRKKQFSIFTKDYGPDTKQIMFIESPASVRNTGFLTFDYGDEEKDDDQWLYLPALGKPKRIASGDKDGSFMGSDLNYSDMTSRNLIDYDFKLIKETTLKGLRVWLIQSIPRSEEVMDETGYKKSILAVRQDNHVVSKIKAWTAEGGYVKIMDFDDIRLIEGIWTPLEIRVSKRLGKTVRHKTRISIRDVKFNRNLSDDLFTLRRLAKGL
jgi:hypothetical protein